MKVVYQAKDRIEAQLLKDFLASFHIEALIQGDYLSGGAGELPALQFPLLWVMDDRDVERSRELIYGYFDQESERQPWRCATCDEQNEGQFHICWKCGTAHE